MKNLRQIQYGDEEVMGIGNVNAYATAMVFSTTEPSTIVLIEKADGDEEGEVEAVVINGVIYRRGECAK